MISARVTAICATIVGLAMGGCTLPASNAPYPPGTVHIPIRVTNESPEMVRVFFVYESGLPVRLGTVPPYSAATISASINRNFTGYLYAHRMSNERATGLNGIIDPVAMAGRTLLVRIGPDVVFDYWQIAN